MKKVILPLCVLLGMAKVGTAQNVCGTDILYQEQVKAHPEIAVYQQQIEEAITQGLQKINVNKLARTTGANDTTTYDIPIVIHVVHDYGQEYLKDDDIFNAVSYWADVYMARNADTADVIAPFKKYVGNAKIRLHLATKDPNGNPTKGITHEHSYLANGAGDQAKLDRWPNTSYLNIWFINNFSASMSGAAAYAYYPSQAQYFPYYDGVIGLYSYLNYDKAIPHEIGHCLELEHVWGNNNQPGVACGDDGIDDTPPTKGHMPGCTTTALYDNTCAVGYQKTYTDANTGSTYVIDYPDTANSQNIMDYTYCQKMFTIGQIQKMRTALTSSIAGRNNLYTAANLAATGALAARPDLAPIADLSIEKGLWGASQFPTADRIYFSAVNSNINYSFRNRSWNDTISSVEWTFSNGATPATSGSLTNVSVKFTQPGWANATLVASSNAGTNTITKQVYIADSVGIQPGGYMNNFASASELANWPMFNYYENIFAWEAYNGAGYDDNSSVRYRSFDSRADQYAGQPDGDRDDVFSPAFNLSAYTSGDLNLNFYTAGSYASANKDSFTVAYSIDGGRTWASFFALTGTSLANNGAKSSEYIPNGANQWLAQTVNVPAAARTAQTYFRFRYLPKKGGNDFYMDKFNISPFTTAVSEVTANRGEVKIYPNPTKGAFTMAFSTGNDGKVGFAVRDLSGKTIYTANQSYAPNSVVEQSIPGNIFPAAGFYIVTVTIADQTTTQKLIVQ